MLSEFLRHSSRPLRLAVLSNPSLETHRLIRSLWSQNHTVFPLLPYKAGHLSHLLTEARCEGLIMSRSLSESITESASIASRSLGLPLIPFQSQQFNSDNIRQGNVILEGVSSFSTVPLAALVEAEAFSSYIDRNRQFCELSPSSHVLSLGRNWLLDAESFNPVFLSTGGSPEVVFVDSDTVTPFINSVKSGEICSDTIKRIVVDAPLIHEAVCLLNEENLRALTELGFPIFVRHVAPEIGPIAPLTPIERLRTDGLLALGGTLRIEESKLMAKKYSLGFTHYIGRAPTSSEAVWPDGYFQCSFAPLEAEKEQPRERRTKRTIMAPDWRVRKVPTAVYHKRRGFKGQIYYTTKHKGWSFYRSRYYN